MKKMHTRFTCRTLLHGAVLLLISSTVAMSADNSCKGLFKVRSQNSSTPTTITFVNKAKTDRAILWLDFNGRPKSYADLSPGKSITLDTYLTHPWMVATGPGDCLQIVMPTPGGSSVQLTEQSTNSGEEGGNRTSCPAGTVPVPETDNCVAAGQAQTGCWYAIYGCSKSKSIDGPGYTVKSDKYAGFDKGMYCNIGGPFDTQKDAQTQIKRFGGEVRRSC